MKTRYPKSQIRDLMERLREVEREREAFWIRQWDGLAVFVSPDVTQVIQLQRPVEELVVVADTFHVKPLIRLLEAADRYDVLCLTQQHVAMYEGNQFALDEIPLRNVPTSIMQVVGPTPQQQPYPHAWSLGQTGSAPAGQRIGGGAGSGSGSGYEANLERFFRVVDKGVWENHSRKARLPLVLCAVEHYHPVFHQVSKNPFLVVEGIKHDPESMTVARLKEEAWKVMEPHHRQQIEKVADMFRSAKARRLGSDEPAQVAEAALQGKVGTVLVEAEKRIDGKIDRRAGTVELGNARPEADDLLDEIAEIVLRRDGQVFVVPHEQMPSESGVAAIYRF
jgi:hypothetical protein